MEFGYSRVSRGKRKSIDPNDRTEAEQEKRKLDNHERSVRRSVANIRRRCLEAQCTHMTTLTYRENMQSREKAIHHRQEFDREMREIYGAMYRQVGVIEEQKRGALHWHMATSLKVDQTLALEVWRRVTGDPLITQVHTGFEPDGKGNAYSKLATYMSKYMKKQMACGEAFDHRFHASRSVEIVKPQRFTIALKAARDTEIKMILEMSLHYLGVDFALWTAPMPAGAQYGFVRCEKIQVQPRGVT